MIDTNNNELKHIETIKTFDPRLPFDSKEEQENASIVWSSRSIDFVYNCINEGVGFRGSPFYRGKPGIRNANLVYQYTEEELEEILKCMDDINYFAEKYVYLKAGKEVSKIKLRPYQKKLLAQYQKERFNIVLQARQTGKTTTTAIYIVWFCLFHTDKTVAILAQRATIAGEIFGKVKGVIGALPFFLKPGVTSWGAEDMGFDNGCRIITRPLRPDCIQGYTVDVIFWDEVAYAKNAYEVWINIYPTISSIPDSKVFLTSTPNGKNYYWELWDGALKKKNKLVPFRVDYWEVPGRDEEWVAQEKANLGDAGFAQQYALSFDAKVKQLLNQDTINYLSKVGYKWKGYHNLATGFDDSFQWTQLFDFNLSQDYFVLSVDVSEGLGQDYSTIKIYKMMPKLGGVIDQDNRSNNISLLNVGVFNDNLIDIKDFAYVIMKLVSRMDQEKVKLIIERNQYGDQLMTHMEYLEDIYPDLEIEFETFAKFYRSKDATKPEKGIRVNASSKRIGVNRFKKYLNDRTFIETDEVTISQIREFGEDDRGRYRATTGHDDLVMPMVNLSYYLEQDFQEWKDFANEFLDTSLDRRFSETLIEPNLKYLERISIKVTEMIKAEQESVGTLVDPANFVYDAQEDIFYFSKEHALQSAQQVAEPTEYDFDAPKTPKQNLYETMVKAEAELVKKNIEDRIRDNAPMKEIMDYAIEHERLEKPKNDQYETWRPIRKNGMGNIDDSAESLMDMF
ncbi:gp87 [Sphingomonas phage PAU]|uniref:gp87 n=1 Tax=Sphingomonas phage PAU TaxID=1150991 RepID=UPI00025731E1|nr:gp87 [Sphingomonas phage PAU]AFF28085.1 gp87 [Sphingomonas phage PAU]